ncbi:hypothetical protein N0V93_008384 [Gnomoniopsis smithogilvyi]|uniref:Uncharacterized protein n=1 Tax=Gnomoniopsis smithogilvyi TaxID=1191159 RepID=A0A9W9CUQ3_9PEZI|nr:hypothetical protein N0V93_008384 [Gnomoniopsis smithogilvyi]
MASGFELTTPLDKASSHVHAVRNSGYGWTMVKELAFGEHQDDLKQMGKVAYLITKGKLTFSRKDKSGRAAFTGRNKVVHLGVQDQGPGEKRAILQRQLTVHKDGLYDIEATRNNKGCVFVEGHVCLSPAFATELLHAGHIHWLDQNGEEDQSAWKSRDADEINVTVPNNETDQNARELQQWFEQEWDDYEKKRGDTRKVDTKTLYRSSANIDKNQRGWRNQRDWRRGVERRWVYNQQDPELWIIAAFIRISLNYLKSMKCDECILSSLEQSRT